MPSTETTVGSLWPLKLLGLACRKISRNEINKKVNMCLQSQDIEKLAAIKKFKPSGFSLYIFLVVLMIRKNPKLKLSFAYLPFYEGPN
jgi:hypothetical protein